MLGDMFYIECKSLAEIEKKIEIHLFLRMIEGFLMGDVISIVTFCQENNIYLYSNKVVFCSKMDIVAIIRSLNDFSCSGFEN